METRRLIWLLLAALSATVAEDTPSYFVVGQELVLEPSVPGSITSILWKYNTNLLAEWVKDKVPLVYYGGFDGRTTLDTGTGRLEIKNMSETDVGVYTVEINNKIQDRRYAARVIVKVVQPTVWVRPVACTSALESCNLTCGGGTPEAEPVSYSWRDDDGPWQVSEKDLIIDEAKARVKSFSCKMKNPVSEEESKPLENPFFVEDSGGSGLWALLLLVPIAALISGLGYHYRHSICQSRGDNRPSSNSADTVEAQNLPKDPNGTTEETEPLPTSSE